MAFLTREQETKDVVFALSKLLNDQDWGFRHYYKASRLAKACESVDFQVFVFDEMFKTARIESVFVHDHPQALFFYLCEDATKTKGNDQRERIRYIQKDRIDTDLMNMKDWLLSSLHQGDIYDFSYGGVRVNLPYEDIYYLEKIDKMVYFHTKKGVFHKRVNISELEKEFEPYGFLRVHVSYIVNQKYITSWFNDMVELKDSIQIPVSRSQHRKIRAKQRETKTNHAI